MGTRALARTCTTRRAAERPRAGAIEENMRVQQAIVFTLGLGVATALTALGAVSPADAQEHGHSHIAAPQTSTAPPVRVQEQGIAFDVKSLNQSGITGTARLTPLAGDRVAVAVAVNGAGTGPRPIHVHEGPCADLNPVPEIPLTTVTNGTSTTEVDVSLQQLTATPHAIFLHKSPEELPVFVACADLLVANAVAAVPSAGEGDADPGLAAGLFGFGGALAVAGYLLRRRAWPSRAG